MYQVRQDAALLLVHAAPPGAAAWQWVDCCVVDVSQPLHPAALAVATPNPSHLDEDGHPKWYLVGAWEHIRIDPSVWGFGPKMGVLQYTVKQATQRLLQFQCAGVSGLAAGGRGQAAPLARA